MAFLDDEAAPALLARRVKAVAGMDIPVREVEAIRARIRKSPAPRKG
jgi:hypothetical protein